MKKVSFQLKKEEGVVRMRQIVLTSDIVLEIEREKTNMKKNAFSLIDIFKK